MNLSRPNASTPQGANSAVLAADLLKAAAAAERVAEARSPEEQARGVMEFWAQKEAIQITQMNAHIDAIATHHRDQDRKPLEVDGDYFAHHVARIPKKLAWHYLMQRNVGWDALADKGGLEDVLKRHPQCRVNIVSGKTSVGYGSKRVRRPRVNFGPGTLQLAP